MSLAFYLSAVTVGLLLAVFGWSLRTLAKHSLHDIDLTQLEDFPRQHVSYFPQVQQALRKEDCCYVISRGSPKLAHKMEAERRRIALHYVAGVRQDFLKLMRLARIITVLSPEVAAVHEFERLRLSVQFAWRYRLICLSLRLGHSPLPLLEHLSQVVSGLSVRIEGAMTDMGERAAIAVD
ncbi:MAG: hypothetical protein PVS2B2_02940 [Candidatus Acidiferrum sp.]